MLIYDKLGLYMTKKIRNTIFVFLVILFLIVAPLTVLYALGWRFDLEDKKIYQTGIFYLRVWPKNVEVHINGELEDKTDIFFGSLLVNNVIPKQYNIEIKKEGYHPWQKNLAIEKKEVTEVNNITLIPNQVELKPILNNIAELYFREDRIITKEINDETWELKLFDPGRNIKSHIISQKDISKNPVEILDLKLSSDGRKILLETKVKSKIAYYLIDISLSPAKIKELDYLESFKNSGSIGIHQIYFWPKNNDKLLIIQSIKERKKEIITLNEVDLESKEIMPALFEDIAAVTVKDNNIYYFDTNGSIFKLNLSLTNQEKLNILNFEYRSDSNYEIITSKDHLILKENKDLYLLNQETKSFDKLFSNASGYQFSPNNEKILYYDKHEIRVLFLERQYDQPARKKYEELFITRFSEEINNVYWYTNHYLIFNIDNKIRISEIDDRDKINMVDLKEVNHQEMFFYDKKLYILDKDTLYSSEELGP